MFRLYVYPVSPKPLPCGLKLIIIFSLNFIQDGCHSKDVEEFDFKFGQKGYENGAGNEIRFEWTNFVWRGFTNIEGNIYAFCTVLIIYIRG